MLNRWLSDIEDKLRYHPLVRRFWSRWTSLRDSLLPRRNPQALARSIRRLCAAARYADSDKRVRSLQQRIERRLQELDEARLDWSQFVPDIAEPWLAKAVVLKPFVGPNEKGVVFISFENQWIKLLRHGDHREFARRYHLVIAPSSSPHNLVNYVFPTAYSGSIFTLISNPGDLDVLPRIAPKFVVVPLYASHWVNPERFRPLPRTDRVYDLVMVTSWGKVKRHFALFKALKKMRPDIRVLLIGQDQEGRSADTIRKEARWYGVENWLTILANQPYEMVTQLLCQAKASVVLSKREGSCVVVAESLFADTPVALLEGAEIGSRV
ncbi:MAG: glycosyltransferase, partial [Gemmataceae bacterium]|nr:glycosyltransferase [Gemmataceae bacterium]